MRSEAARRKREIGVLYVRLCSYCLRCFLCKPICSIFHAVSHSQLCFYTRSFFSQAHQELGL